MGRVRSINQDYIIYKLERVNILPNLFLLADGVGSNKESGFASKHTCDFIMDAIERVDDSASIVEKMSTMYKLANADLFNRIEFNESYRGMGTTLVMASIDNDKLYVGNVGDSRLYHVRGTITRITHDHTLAEDFVKAHQIERDSEDYKKYKNQLTRAIGGGSKIRPDFFELDIMEGDYILMCSDGLYNMLSDKEIFDIVNKKEKTLEERADELIAKANENGGKDNIAVLLIYIDSIDKTAMLFQEDSKDMIKNYTPHIEVGKEGENNESKWN